MSYNNTVPSQIQSRRMIIARREGCNQPVSVASPLWEPLAYPLFFPSGTLGWGLTNTTPADLPPSDDCHAVTTQLWFYRARILREPRFQWFGRLTGEYLVDMFTRDLESRLNYIRMNQNRIRDAECATTGDHSNAGSVYLPSSFLGSRRWASEQIADGLALAASFGPPTFFATFTCNPHWPEITSQLRAGQQYHDVPVVVARVFKQRFSHFLKTLSSMFPNAGGRQYIVYSTEFQKRGLPHCHVLIKFDADCILPVDIDNIVSAEIPDDPNDAALVHTHMMHSHPSPLQPPSRYCQREDSSGHVCRFSYPQPLQEMTSVDTSGKVHYRRRNQHDQMVVPYSLSLLRMYECHINLEVASAVHLFQYIFKYIHKGICIDGCYISSLRMYVGPDRARVQIKDANAIVDEIDDFWQARYLSAGEACWRILGFRLTTKQPAVTALPIDTPNSFHHLQYSQRNHPSSPMSKLERYFVRPRGFFVDEHHCLQSFNDLTYAEYYQRFRLQNASLHKNNNELQFWECPNRFGQPIMSVVRRVSKSEHITRVQPMSPSQGERFYIRALLLSKPARSFDDLRTIDGSLMSSFEDAAKHSGFFHDQAEDIFAITEAISMLYTPKQLRVLFVNMLTNNCCLFPLAIWNEFHPNFGKDFLQNTDGDNERASKLTLQDIALLLQEHGKSLATYGLPQPIVYGTELSLERQHWHSIRDRLEEDSDTTFMKLNVEQQQIFREIDHALLSSYPLRAFIDGPADTGKSFLVTACCNRARSRDQIVLATASSAFAAQLFPGGRTTHAAFKVISFDITF